MAGDGNKIMDVKEMLDRLKTKAVIKKTEAPPVVVVKKPEVTVKKIVGKTLGFGKKVDFKKTIAPAKTMDFSKSHPKKEDETKKPDVKVTKSDYKKSDAKKSGSDSKKPKDE
jgi:hypothetical protein